VGARIDRQCRRIRQEDSDLGPNPRASLIFTSNGRYSLYISRASLPKFAAGNREKGTADENKAVVGGVISHIGRYTVDEKDKTFTFHVESSTYPNWDGTAQKRPFTVSGDELKYTNALLRAVDAPTWSGSASSNPREPRDRVNRGRVRAE